LNEEPFCLVALLKAGESLDRVTNLLPPARREIVLRLATEFSNLPTEKLREKLAAVREAAVLRTQSWLNEELGQAWRELPSLLQCWIAQAAPRTHGNQDHQE
jgi:hypothetical protein